MCVPECASQRPTSAVVARPLPQGQTSPSRLSRLACPWAQSSSSPHLPSAGITTAHHHSWLCPVGSWGRTQSKASVHLLNPMAQSLSLATVYSTIYFCLSMRSIQQSLEHRKLSKKNVCKWGKFSPDCSYLGQEQKWFSAWPFSHKRHTRTLVSSWNGGHCEQCFLRNFIQFPLQQIYFRFLLNFVSWNKWLVIWKISFCSRFPLKEY